MSGGSKLDANQVLKAVYDEINNKLGVAATVTASIGESVIKDTENNFLDVNPDGSINVNVVNGIDIEIDAADGDSIKVSDGTNSLSINPDGSINVKTDVGLSTSFSFNEVTSVGAATLTNVISYDALLPSKLERILVSGTNIAEYLVFLDEIVIAKQRTYFSSGLNSQFDFGVNLAQGSNITVKVIHNRSNLGDFNASLVISQGGI